MLLSILRVFPMETLVKCKGIREVADAMIPYTVNPSTLQPSPQPYFLPSTLLSPTPNPKPYICTLSTLNPTPTLSNPKPYTYTLQP